jgi:hypothetical protein
MFSLNVPGGLMGMFGISSIWLCIKFGHALGLQLGQI